MKFLFRTLITFIFCAFAAASLAQAQDVTFPGADRLICNIGDTMKTCQVVNLDPANLVLDNVGNLRVTIVEDTRCPRFARCRDAGHITLKFSVIEASSLVETQAVEITFKRNQDNPIQIELSDGSVLNIDVLAVTHKVRDLPPSLFEIKIGYTLDSM